MGLQVGVIPVTGFQQNCTLLWDDATKDAVMVDPGGNIPRLMAALTETLPEGQPVPNLADLLQERCEKLLEQVCMPVQG